MVAALLRSRAAVHARLPPRRPQLLQPVPGYGTSRAGPQLAARRTLFTRKTPAQRLKNRAWTAAGLVLGGLLAVYAYDSSAGIHRWLVIPLLHAWTKDDPEESHRLAIKALASGLSPVDLKADQEDVLGFDLWGRHFSNPVGLAAGFDKHGEAIDGLFNLGFGYVEIGSITPEAQEGNPKPRLFRLPESQSVINRYGFNSDGHLAVLERLRARVHAWLVKNANILPESVFTPPQVTADSDPDPVEAILRNQTDAQVIDELQVPRSLNSGKVLAVNLGKNKKSPADAIDDYVNGVQTLGPYADVLVVNVSSPNTPGLRSLQRREIVQELLKDVVKARNDLKLSHKPAVVLKIAPDLSQEEVADIGAAAKESKIDGIIVSNTTISRPRSAGLDETLKEAGGLSGPSVKPLALRVLHTLYAYTDGEIPLIGCGGISTGEDALDYARAGASFVQLYTALGYQGVGLPRMIKDEIVAQLKAENKTWKDVIGSGIDISGIRALGGRVSNPASALALEQEAAGGMERLKLEVEAALNGERPILPESLQTYEERFARFLPDWSNYSPVVAAQSTTPSAITADTDSAQSGMLPEGYPQIVILQEGQQYPHVDALTKEDVQAKWREVRSQAQEAGQVIAGAAHEAADVTKALGRDVGHELREVGHIVEDAAHESADAFRRVAHDAKHDPALGKIQRGAAEAGHIVGDAAHDAADGFRKIGRDIRRDPAYAEIRKTAQEAGEIIDGSAHEIADASRRLGRDIRDDPAYAKLFEEARRAGTVIDASAHESLASFSRVGEDIKHDPAYEKILREAQKAGTVIDASAHESAAAFRRVGHDMKHDPAYEKILREAQRAGTVIDASAHESADAFRRVGEDIKHDPAYEKILREAQRAGTVVDASAHESADAFKRVGKDIKHDPAYEKILREAQKAGTVIDASAHESAAGFKRVGQDIRHDPAYDVIRRETKEARDEAQYVEQKFQEEGARSESQTYPKGLSSLFSSFGERKNVTQSSKRLV